MAANAAGESPVLEGVAGKGGGEGGGGTLPSSNSTSKMPGGILGVRYRFFSEFLIIVYITEYRQIT